MSRQSEIVPRYTTRKHLRHVLVLAFLFAIVWVLAAIAPNHRSDWALENVLTLIVVPILVGTYYRFPLSRVSYTLIFVFLCLHTIGSHYTYAEVPYNEWSEAILGISINEFFGWERNHYDRLIHFFYGLLIAYPIREIYLRIADVRGFWGYALPVSFAMASSLTYELLEWAAATVFGGDLGVAYLGTQGDPWDAQKDMSLAVSGALIAMSITAILNYRYQRDFAREWSESLRVKHPAPLGEVRFQGLRNLAARRGKRET